jgi:replicative DNA helicase
MTLALEIPQSLESETAVLCAMVLSANDDEPVYSDIISRLRSPDWFMCPQNRDVFSAILDLKRSSKPVDFVQVKAWLKGKKGWDDQQCNDELKRISEGCPSYKHGPAYADEVREKARLRRCQQIGDALRADASEKGAHADPVCAKAVTDLVKVQSLGQLNTLKTISELACDVYEAIDGQSVPLATTGYKTLDARVGGIGSGETIVVAARPSMGKGVLRNGMALGMARAGIGVVIISLEDRAQKITRNMLSAIASVENHKIRQGGDVLSREERIRLADATTQLGALPITIIDNMFTLSEVASAISAGVGRHGAQVVMIDYLQLIKPEGNKSREQEVASVSRELAILARRMGYRQVLLAQVNRASEHHAKLSAKSPVPPAPRMSDLRESGQIEQDADGILIIHRPDYYLAEATRISRGDFKQTHCAEIHIAKWKDAERGEIVNLHTELQYQRFNDKPPYVDPFEKAGMYGSPSDN